MSFYTISDIICRRASTCSKRSGGLSNEAEGFCKAVRPIISYMHRRCCLTVPLDAGAALFTIQAPVARQASAHSPKLSSTVTSRVLTSDLQGKMSSSHPNSKPTPAPETVVMTFDKIEDQEETQEDLQKVLKTMRPVTRPVVKLPEQSRAGRDSDAPSS